MFDQILSNATSKRPLVHCITNHITVSDGANVIAACSASPIMTDDHNEVEDI
jgi:hydroxyethylthiazole kinase